MPIASFEDLVEGLEKRIFASGDKVYSSSGSDSAGWSSYWTLAGGRWGAGAIPGAASGEALNNLSIGALPLPDPPVGSELRLASIKLVTIGSAGSITHSTLVVYDRLVHTGTLNGSLTTLQPVNSVALPRYTDGEGVYPYLEIYTNLGGTGVTGTITYVNQDGVTSTVNILVGGTTTRFATTLARIPLAVGDTGVRSITDITLSATTGNVGAFGFTLLKPLLLLPIATPTTNEIILDWADLGLPVIPEDTCMGIYGTDTGARQGFLLDLGFVIN